MSGQTTTSGTLTAGPAMVTDTTFPSSQSTFSLGTSTNPKSWAVCTGTLSRTIAATIGGGTWVTLDGVGTGKTVEECDYLVIRSNAKVLIRYTQKVGLSTITSTIYFKGLHVLESPPDCPVVLIEVQGAATIEYLAQGLK